MTTQPSKNIAVPWYRADQWTTLRAVAPDGNELEPTHAEWLKNVSTRIYDLERQGFVVRKVDVELHALLRWCEARNLQPDTNARGQYAATHAG